MTRIREGRQCHYVIECMDCLGSSMGITAHYCAIISLVARAVEVKPATGCHYIRQCEANRMNSQLDCSSADSAETGYKVQENLVIS